MQVVEIQYRKDLKDGEDSNARATFDCITFIDLAT